MKRLIWILGVGGALWFALSAARGQTNTNRIAGVTGTWNTNTNAVVIVQSGIYTHTTNNHLGSNYFLAGGGVGYPPRWLAATAITSSALTNYDTRELVLTNTENTVNANVTVNIAAFAGVDGTGATDSTLGIQAVLDAHTNTTQEIITRFLLPPGTYNITNSIKIRREGIIFDGGNEMRTVITTSSNINAFEFVPGPLNQGGNKAMNFALIENLTITGPGRSSSTMSGVYVGDVANPVDPDGHYNLITLRNLDITRFAIGVSCTNTYGVLLDHIETQENTIGFALHKADLTQLDSCKVGFQVTGYQTNAADQATIGYLNTGNSFSVIMRNCSSGPVWKPVYSTSGSGDFIVEGGEFQAASGTNMFHLASYATIIGVTVDASSTNNIFVFDMTGANAGAITIIGGAYSDLPGNDMAFRVTGGNYLPDYSGTALSGTNAYAGGTFKLPKISMLSVQTSDSTSGGTNFLEIGTAGSKYWGMRLNSAQELAFDKNYASAWGNALTIKRTNGEVVITAGRLQLGTSVTIQSGGGDPEGSVTANVGSLYLSTSGGGIPTLWTKDSGTGNTGWSSSGNYASMHIESVETLAMPASAYHTITNYDVVQSSGFSVSTANGTITNTYAGVYKVDIAVSFMGANSVAYECEVFTNTVASDRVAFERTMGSSATIGVGAASGIYTLPANTRLDVQIKNDGGTANVVLEKVQFVVTQLR